MDTDDQYSLQCAQLSERMRSRGGSRRGGPRNGLSTDPQSVAARERRHRISDRFRILKSLVPGGNKLDTVSMLEEAINYVKFLKAQIMLHQTLLTACSTTGAPPGTSITGLNSTNHEGFGYNQQMVINPNDQEFLNYSMAQSEHALPPLPCSIQDEEDEDMLRP